MKTKVEVNIIIETESQIQAIRKAATKFHGKWGELPIEVIQLGTSPSDRGSHMVTIKSEMVDASRIENE